MGELRVANTRVHDWLRQIPPKHWARSHFSGRANCDILLNNICESFNSKLVDARDKPIITCVEYIREYMMRRIVVVQKVIDKCDGPLTPTAALIFDAIKKEATKYTVIFNGVDQYQVKGPWQDQTVVNTTTKKCSCRKWELTDIPCKHAVAAIWNMSENDEQPGEPEEWVHSAYRLETWKEVYKHVLNPVTGPSTWPTSDCTLKLLPPHHHTQVGRPTKKRKRAADERVKQSSVSGGKLSRVGKTVTCSKCGQKGHNQRKCKGQIPPGSSQPKKKQKKSKPKAKVGTSQTSASQASASHGQGSQAKAGASQAQGSQVGAGASQAQGSQVRAGASQAQGSQPSQSFGTQASQPISASAYRTNTSPRLNVKRFARAN